MWNLLGAGEDCMRSFVLVGCTRLRTFPWGTSQDMSTQAPFPFTSFSNLSLIFLCSFLMSNWKEVHANLLLTNSLIFAYIVNNKPSNLLADASESDVHELIWEHLWPIEQMPLGSLLGYSCNPHNIDQNGRCSLSSIPNCQVKTI